MENFEEELSKLLFSKANHTPNPQASLELLLKHVYDTVLVPTHRILQLQEKFASSTVQFDKASGYGDMGDGFEDRPLATLTVCRSDEEEPLFVYDLSFDGDRDSQPAALWSHIIAPNYVFPSDGEDGAAADANSYLNEFDYKRFPTLDMKKAVELVQIDLLESFDQLL